MAQNDNNHPFFKAMKSALVENRFDNKTKTTPQERLAALEKRLDREKLTDAEIEEIRKEIAHLQDRLAGK